MLSLCSLALALQHPVSVAPRATGSSLGVGRRALLGSSSAAAGLLLSRPFAAAAKEKEYITISEYQAKKAQEKKDQDTYTLFESLRDRASQTSEFNVLAEKDDFTGVSKLALAWDSSIRKQVLEESIKSLDQADKDAGSKLNKLVLNDLKSLDKLAKASDKEAIPGASQALRDHVLEFVALTPQRLTDKFGVSDL